MLEHARSTVDPAHLGDVWQVCRRNVQKESLDRITSQAKHTKLAQESLQNFSPAEGKYDLIFIQWAALYLTDDDLVATLIRCRQGLTPTGIILLKENITRDGTFHVDKQDSSITRSDAQHWQAFRKAGLVVLHEARQKDWPADLFPVKMYALR
jgi:protein N-terminal methyltransferase